MSKKIYDKEVRIENDRKFSKIINKKFCNSCGSIDCMCNFSDDKGLRFDRVKLNDGHDDDFLF